MGRREDLQASLEFNRKALKSLRDAYLALVDGQAQSYTIGSRNLTKLDLAKLSEEITAKEKLVSSLEAQLNGGGARKAVGIIPRDW